MNITVIGAGAIGLLLAGSLAPHAESLELITRSEAQAAELRADGLSVDGSVIVPTSYLRIRSFERKAEECNQPQADYVLLTVKQSALDDSLMSFAAAQLGPENGKLVCFQNGLGHIERLQHFIPAERLFIAVTTEGAKKTGASSVLHTGRGSTYIGSPVENFADSRNSDIKDLCEMLNAAGFRAETSNRMISRVWNKLIINATINPVTALLGVSNGKLLDSKATLSLMRDIYEEAMEVARLQAVELSTDLWEQIAQVCRMTSDNHSSMLQDLLAGRRTEIDWITGALLAIGQSGGLSLPVNETVYRLVKAMEPE